MICQKCGTDTKSAGVCPNCGADTRNDITHRMKEDWVRSARPQQYNATPKKKARGCFVAFIVAICMVAAISFTLLGAALNEAGHLKTSRLFGILQGDASSLDLSGEWEQADKNSEDTYQIATIQGDTIEVYWYMPEDGTKALYWAGTFVAPATPGNSYTWESVNDTEKTSTALLASTADTKVFTYENGEIVYEASAMGVTKTVRLVRAR